MSDATKWEPIDRYTELEVGRLYRVSWTMAAREIPLDTLGRIADFLNGTNAFTGSYHFTGVEYTPGGASSGKKIPWRLSIMFQKTGGGTPALIIVGLIIAALVALGLTLFGAGYLVEQQALSELGPDDRKDVEMAKAGSASLGGVATIAAVVGIAAGLYAFARR